MGKFDNDLGPILIDSLDKPNAGPPKPPSSKPIDPTGMVAIVVGIGAVLLVALFVFIVQSLRYEAEYNFSTGAVFLLWAIYSVPLLVLLFSLLVGSWYAIQWLRAWAIKNKIITLQNGPFVNADSIHVDYQAVFDANMNKVFDVLLERAKQSTYQGVQTLTQSSNTSSTTNSSAPEADSTEKDKIKKPDNGVFSKESGPADKS